MDIPKDLNYKILLELDDKDLVNFCQTSKRARNYCNDDSFWLQRIMFKFPHVPLEILKNYKGDRSWADYYIYDLRKIDYDSDFLHEAILDGRLDHVMILNDHKIRYEGALADAVSRGNIDIVKYLSSKHYWILPYHLVLAVINNRFDVLKFLVDNGADVNSDFFYKDFTPLIQAKQLGRTEMVKYLIEKGAK